jgi:cytochrome c oxidase cbb3-type subunit 3
MSDFTSSHWSLYITTISLLGIVACLVLLWVTARKKSVGNADNTTGHVWDEDLREMNNPLPLWWVGLFVLSVIFGLCYLWLFPGLGNYKGSKSWTSQSEYTSEMADAEKALAPLYASFDAMTVEQLAKDPKAMAIGERLFMNNCAQCHGSDAQGTKGFPNLTDGDWLYGGDPATIKATITQGRQGVMPVMAQAVGSPKEISEVAHYVLSLSDSPHDSLKAAAGKAKFTVCASCHGMDGKGNPAVGAPNLTDKIWLHGWGEQAITQMVNNGKVNVMPAQKDRLSVSQIHVLTGYVWSLSHTSTMAN